MEATQILRWCAAAALVPALLVEPIFAWGPDGHRMINRLAAANLPADVPAFLHTPAGLDAMEYFGPEPDRWKSRAEPELSSAGSPEHYIDLEWADLIGGPLPRNRYDFVRALAVAQKSHLDLPLTPEKVGLQPYVANEGYERLKAAMREYRGLVSTHGDTRPVEGEIIVLAGVLGHYVADASMPLHTSVQFNGWTGPNPKGYTTEHRIHAQFETTFVAANVSPTKDVAPLVAAARPVVMGDFFDDYVHYLRHSNTLVEPTYQLEKTGAFNGAGTPEGRAFVDERLAAGAIELRNVIYTAWVKSAEPVPEYRNSQQTGTPPQTTPAPKGSFILTP